MAAFDIFALTSREDPYPLVMLEAANQGLPIVCFRPSGGAVEFVEDDSGIVVPDFDSARFAQAVLALVDNPTLRSQYGNCAQAKVRQRHTVPMGAAHLWQTLCRLAALPQ